MDGSESTVVALVGESTLMFLSLNVNKRRWDGPALVNVNADLYCR